MSPIDDPLPDAQPASRRAARVIGGLLGLALGAGALAWCAALALRPENRAQLEHLGSVSAGAVALLVFLSLATLVINGEIFHVVILPVRRLRAADVQAVNAIATFLAYLPAKLGLASRVLIHHRRDRIPITTIGAWLAAEAVLLGCIVGPMLVGALLRPGADGWFGLIWGLGALGATAGAILGARALRGERGTARLGAIARTLRLPLVAGFLRTRIWRDLHAGADMLGSLPASASAVVLRVLDLCVQAARLVVAAEILGQPLAPGQALLIGAAYFVIGVLSPAGLMGLPQLGATGLAGALAIAGSGEFAAVALLVGAVEAVVNLAGVAIGLAWLGPMRLLALRAAPDGPGATAPPARS